MEIAELTKVENLAKWGRRETNAPFYVEGVLTYFLSLITTALLWFFLGTLCKVFDSMMALWAVRITSIVLISAATAEMIRQIIKAIDESYH